MILGLIVPFKEVPSVVDKLNWVEELVNEGIVKGWLVRVWFEPDCPSSCDLFWEVSCVFGVNSSNPISFN
jgi:hypothetical protein